MAHARGFADGLDGSPTRWADLGPGGGLPGLVLAQLWTGARGVLIEASRRRATFLDAAVRILGLDQRVEVVWVRAEEAGRRPDLRGQQDAVVARSFGPPAVTAECGAPLLRTGGLLVVSEPPEGRDGPEEAPERWPAAGLAELGLEPARTWESPFHFQALRQIGPCPERYPRRVGIPAKRPLF